MALTVTVDLPADVERQLRAANPDLDASAKEAVVVSLYRQGQITHFELSKLLGLDRFQTEDVLHKHNVIEDLGTLADYEADAETLRNLRPANQ